MRTNYLWYRTLNWFIWKFIQLVRSCYSTFLSTLIHRCKRLLFIISYCSVLVVIVFPGELLPIVNFWCIVFHFRGDMPLSFFVFIYIYFEYLNCSTVIVVSCMYYCACTNRVSKFRDLEINWHATDQDPLCISHVISVCSHRIRIGFLCTYNVHIIVSVYTEFLPHLRAVRLPSPLTNS